MNRTRLTVLVLLALGVSFAPGADAATLARGKFVLPSTISVDTTAHTVTLPLRHGTFDGKSVWYVETDASSVRIAKRDRVVFSPSLASIGSDATQSATLSGGVLHFAGVPDFSPTRTYVASTGGFPPKSATPGGVADKNYSPFVRVAGQPGVLNAPIVAVGEGPFDVTTHTNTEDRVVAIDTAKGTVTLVAARGFVDGKPVYYLSTEASDPVAAAVERATYVPRLAKAGPAATIPIGVVVNGPQTGTNVQGLAYLALRTPLGEDATAANAASIGVPFNVLSLVPNLAHPYASNGYSPLWSVRVQPKGGPKRYTSYAQIAATAQPAGFSVNCPVIAFADPGAGY